MISIKYTIWRVIDDRIYDECIMRSVVFNHVNIKEIDIISYNVTNIISELIYKPTYIKH